MPFQDVCGLDCASRVWDACGVYGLEFGVFGYRRLVFSQAAKFSHLHISTLAHNQIPSAPKNPCNAFGKLIPPSV
jgi:hypothetical protein